jgi:alkanesulfonate monooxygenase SsuD/methylene tetrahydromethanopterin reductase-like flavin-dependent oxidoreductase (luciferase family)
MKFGVFDHLERRDGELSVLYRQRLEMLAYADQAGFWGYHKAEHHFIDLDVAPSSIVFLAAASQRTEQIRFGALVYLLPFYHPLRLVEEICILDHLCQGRLEVGVGRGISPVEHRLWGLEPEHAKVQFEEAFDVVRQGLGSDVVDFTGEHYSFKSVPAPMSPAQGRMPGFWYAGNAEYAAAHRMSTIVSGPIESISARAVEFRRRLAEPTVDWNRGVREPTFAVKRHVFVAPTDALAHEAVARAYPIYHQHLARLWRQYNEPFPNIDPSFGGDMHKAVAAGDLVIGAPETVSAHIARLRDEVQAEYVIGAFAWGDLSHAETMASMGLFACEVMPRFQ